MCAKYEKSRNNFKRLDAVNNIIKLHNHPRHLLTSQCLTSNAHTLTNDTHILLLSQPYLT